MADYYKIKVATCTPSARASWRGGKWQWRWPGVDTDVTAGDRQNFGGRDHTTVLHACRQIASLRESASQIQHDFAFLLQVLRS